VLLHGTTDERAMLLFSIADKSQSLCLDKNAISTLAGPYSFLSHVGHLGQYP
jgi:hypothetical protein